MTRAANTSPAPVRAAADKLVADNKPGALNPITCPIKDQNGADNLAASAKIADGDLLKMGWCVEGAQS